LPTVSGVYQFLDEKGNVIYVGKAKDLRKRVSSYFSNKDLGEKTKKLVSKIQKIKTIEVTSEIEAFLLEERLIKKFRPIYNIRLIDGKTFLGLKITIKDEYPKVLLTRKVEKDGALYFGPFTSSSSLKTVLKLTRKIFPYQSVLNHPNSICLYNHLGLCPCPTVTKDNNYKRNVRHLIDFLNGETNKVIRSLEKERNEFSADEDFESARLMQNKIDAINLITSPIYKPFEYEENPNLRSDVINRQLDDLKQILNDNNVPVKDLERVECYDISNTSGTNATGSMVVFTNGEKDSSSYRRFKIKKDYRDLPNDFAMLGEVLQRRINRSDWPKPSLIIVDGGKGQVSSADKIFKINNYNVPLVGLAKREEIIITPEFKEIKLGHNTKPLQFIMRIRDEAHRFAITYHRKLRSKSFLPS
jgi:excinuclease ABC subunit C